MPLRLAFNQCYTNSAASHTCQKSDFEVRTLLPLWQNHIVPTYPSKIAELINACEMSKGSQASDVTGRSASFDCGSFVEFSLQIDAETRKIENVRYRTNGCGYMIAAAESVRRFFRGCALTELHGPANIHNTVLNAIGPVPAPRVQCIDLAIIAFRSALTERRRQVIEEFQGERALICTCFGVSEERILSDIDANPNADLVSIGRSTNAGTGCGSCQMLIADLIESANADLRVRQ